MATVDDCMDSVEASIKDAIAAAELPANWVYPGWPEPEDLQKDLRNHICHVSIFSSAHSGKPAGGATMQGALELAAPVITLTAELSGGRLSGGDVSTAASGTITLGGTTGSKAITIAEIGKYFVSYKPVDEDTLHNDALGLVVAINSNTDVAALVTATCLTNVVTVTANAVGDAGNAIHLGYKIGGTGESIQVIRSQSGGIEIHVWAYDNDSRKLFANTIDNAFANVRLINFPDSSSGRMTYRTTTTTDAEVRHGVFRRILRYDIQYDETLITPTYTVLEGLVMVVPDRARILPATNTTPAPPVINGITPDTEGNFVTLAHDITIFGTAELASTVTVQINAETLTTLSNELTGIWSVVPATLPTGTYTAGAHTTNAGGASSTVTQDIQVVDS